MGTPSSIFTSDHHQQSFDPPNWSPQGYDAQTWRSCFHHSYQYLCILYLDSRTTPDLGEIRKHQQHLGSLWESHLPSSWCCIELLLCSNCPATACGSRMWENSLIFPLITDLLFSGLVCSFLRFKRWKLAWLDSGYLLTCEKWWNMTNLCDSICGSLVSHLAWTSLSSVWWAWRTLSCKSSSIQYEDTDANIQRRYMQFHPLAYIVKLNIESMEQIQLLSPQHTNLWIQPQIHWLFVQHAS